MTPIALTNARSNTLRSHYPYASPSRRHANAASRARCCRMGRGRSIAIPVSVNISEPRMSSRTCCVEGCNRRIDARGMCSTHYARVRSRGTTDKWIRPRKPSAPRLNAWRLRELLRYDPQQGAFQWITDHASSRAGTTAGRVYPNGYVTVWIDGRQHRAHRLAWLYVHGAWPTRFIDHINGDKRDNRIENLRDVAPLVNCQNRRSANPTNKSGLLGVHWNAGRWTAFITHERKSIYLGRFRTPELAHEAYLRAKRQIHAGCTL